ncbi:hypothetical protein L6R29_18020 [Myxococcota bacterium]|nr:hypothetical protein [Myxococcota bacterium]
MRKPISVLGLSVPVRLLWVVLCWSVALLWATPAQADTPRTSATQPAWLERPLLARLSKPAELHTRFQRAWFPTPSTPNDAHSHELLDTIHLNSKLPFTNLGLFVSLFTTMPVHLGVMLAQLIVSIGKNLLHKRVWGIIGIVASTIALAWGTMWFVLDTGNISEIGWLGHIGLTLLGLGALAWSIVNLVAGLKQPSRLAEVMPFTIVPTFSASATEGTNLGFAFVGHF